MPLRTPTNTPLSSMGTLSAKEITASNANFMSKVYLWMAGGVSLSATIAFFVADSPAIATTIITNKFLFYALFIGQLAAVLSFSLLLHRVSVAGAISLYVIYCILSGLTLSIIFFAFTLGSIGQAFAITSFMFAGLSIFGFVTKIDLKVVGTFCMCALWGLIGFALLSFFIPSLMSSQASWIYSIVSVIIFSGLTAYDTQKIKQFNSVEFGQNENTQKGAIYGALTLYLDFINLFLSLLRLTGKRR